MLSFEHKLDVEFISFQNYYLDCSKFRQISGIRHSQFQIAVVLMIRELL